MEASLVKQLLPGYYSQQSALSSLTLPNGTTVLTPPHLNTLPPQLQESPLSWPKFPVVVSLPTPLCPSHVVIPLRVLVSNKVEKGVSGNYKTFKKYL